MTAADLRHSREEQLCSFLYACEIKAGTQGKLQEGRRKRSGDWITGELRSCTLWRAVITPPGVSKAVNLAAGEQEAGPQENLPLKGLLQVWGVTAHCDLPT